jgi:hypothetical protein
MLELEAHSGDWYARVIEQGDRYGQLIERKIREDGEMVWSASKAPRPQPFSEAKRMAAEYVAHVIDIQHPSFRDRVYLVSPSSEESHEVILPEKPTEVALS